MNVFAYGLERFTYGLERFISPPTSHRALRSMSHPASGHRVPYGDLHTGPTVGGEQHDPRPLAVPRLPDMGPHPTSQIVAIRHRDPSTASPVLRWRRWSTRTCRSAVRLSRSPRSCSEATRTRGVRRRRDHRRGGGGGCRPRRATAGVGQPRRISLDSRLPHGVSRLPGRQDRSAELRRGVILGRQRYGSSNLTPSPSHGRTPSRVTR